MGKDSCPHCHTRSGLHKQSILVLSLENWPQILLFTFLVIIFAEKFSIDALERSVFLLLALIPVVITFEKKTCCDNCGVEFRDSPRSIDTSESASDLYKL